MRALALLPRLRRVQALYSKENHTPIAKQRITPCNNRGVVLTEQKLSNRISVLRIYLPLNGMDPFLLRRRGAVLLMTNSLAGTVRAAASAAAVSGPALPDHVNQDGAHHPQKDQPHHQGAPICLQPGSHICHLPFSHLFSYARTGMSCRRSPSRLGRTTRNTSTAKRTRATAVQTLKGTVPVISPPIW